MKLSKRNVDALKVPDKSMIVWDDDLGGFGIRVSPKGRKSFLVQYRVSGKNRRTRRVIIGVYRKISCEQARLKAKSLLAQAVMGDNPLKERDEIKIAKRTGQLLVLFYDEHVAVKLAARTQEAYAGIIRTKFYQNHFWNALLRT